MDPYEQQRGMNKLNYSAMHGQGGHSMAGTGDPNLFQNMQYNQSIGFGNGGGLSHIESMLPPNDQNMSYYQEYCRLFIANVVLTTQMKELIAEKNELIGRISELEKGGVRTSKHSTADDLGIDKKTRIRRKANDVERNYQCPVTTCQKSYGAEGSLMQHIKLKHPEITQNPEWREKFMKTDEEE